MRQEGGLRGTALPRDVDFLLFGVTTEEIRWLQSGVVVPRVTHRGGAGTFVSGRDANVVRETVIATPRLSCLTSSRRPLWTSSLWAPAWEG